MTDKRSDNITSSLAAQFQYTIEMSQEAVFWLERSGQFTYVNDKACHSLGYAREELLSLYLWDIDPDYPVERWNKQWDNLREIGMRTFETRHRRKDGCIFPVEVCACQVIFEGNEFHTAFVRDITERKRAEKELIMYRDHLESLVEEKTKKLKEAQSELLKNERLSTLGRLTATVSHELLNPLGTIRNAMYSINRGLDNNDLHLVHRALELAERNILRSVNIVEELNDYARVRELTVTDVFLDEWLESLFDELDIPENLNCELNLSSGVRAEFDQEKLRQVIVNLVNNGIQALLDENSTGNLLQVSTGLQGDEYIIDISDNGIGMPDETQERMFEPLYSTKGFGVGLGMAVVKNIVEQHCGEICINSNSGAGTIVTLRMPLKPMVNKVRVAKT